MWRILFKLKRKLNIKSLIFKNRELLRKSRKQLKTISVLMFQLPMKSEKIIKIDSSISLIFWKFQELINNESQNQLLLKLSRNKNLLWKITSLCVEMSIQWTKELVINHCSYLQKSIFQHLWVLKDVLFNNLCKLTDLFKKKSLLRNQDLLLLKQ